MLMVNQEAAHIPTPAERALEVAGEVHDLTNQLLFNRVGQEGMQAAADQTAADELLNHLEADLTVGQVALESVFRDHDNEMASRELFDGRSFSELNPVDQERARTHAVARRKEEKLPEVLEETSPEKQVAIARKQLDAELNRTFNTPVLSDFLYYGSQQDGNRVVLNATDLAAVSLPLPGLKIKTRMIIERVGGEAEARIAPVIIDEKTHRPIDILDIMRNNTPLSERDDAEMVEWLQGYKTSDETVEDVTTRLEAVKNYLQDQLRQE